MHIPALHNRINPANLPLEKLAANPNVSDQDKVTEACRQFEAVLLRQILQATRKTVIASSELPESTTSDIYNDMINNELADKISESGEFGLAKSLQTQLVRQVLPEADAARAKAGHTPLQPLNTPKIKP